MDPHMLRGPTHADLLSGFVLQDIMLFDPLHEMTEAQKDTLWEHRHLLCHYPEAITKFLRAINWADSERVREAHQLLHLWTPPGPLEALQVSAYVYVCTYAYICVHVLVRVDGVL